MARARHTYSTNAAWLHAISEERGVPLRTLADVQASMARDKRKPNGCDVAMANLMIRHGRLTDDARDWVAREYTDKIAARYGSV